MGLTPLMWNALGTLALATQAGPPRPLSVPVQALVVSDDDGGRRARATGEQFAQWIEFANSAFGEARIQFTFDPDKDLLELSDTVINDLVGAGAENWPAAKRRGNEIAARHPGRLVVFVRHGPGPAATGAGFGGTDLDFVVLGGFEDMRHCGHPHVDALAHEIGHYLGLPHTFVGEPFADVEAAAAHLAAHGGDPLAFDGDGFADTPPDPAIRSLECEREPTVVLGGQTFVLPRRNLMSYYDERDSLTPLQIARARWILERRLTHDMRLPVNRPGAGAHEAEALRVLSTASCSTTVQAMDGFGVGGWSGGTQLFCGAAAGAVLELELAEIERGTHELVLYATLAPDFGSVRCKVDGKRFGPDLDLYAPVVLPTGAIPLGRLRLAAGAHRIAFEVVGKHAESTGHHFGSTLR